MLQSPSDDEEIPLKNFRHAAGLTQNDVARRLGVTQVSVADMERRGMFRMKIGTLSRYLEACDVSLDMVMRCSADAKVIAEVKGSE